MNSKQRVKTALSHKQPDKTPFLAFLTGEVQAKLNDLYGLSGQDLFVHLGHDVLVSVAGIWRRTWVDKDNLVDTWGIRWHNVDYGPGKYLEILEHPLANVDDVDAYTFPDPKADFANCDIDKLLECYGQSHWIVGGPVGTMFETAWMLRGLEQFMIDLVINPTFAEELVEHSMRYHLEIAKLYVKKGVDMIWTGDDFGQQHKLMMSPKMWRRIFKPRYREFYAELKQLNPNLFIAHHSDGFIEPIIPDFIEIGLDVLQAVQPQSMDPARLKQTYGDNLSYWGSMDVQHTFPYGTPEDVADEVRQRIAVVGKNGGLILAPAHGIQPDVPLENLRAYYATLRPENAALYSRLEGDLGEPPSDHIFILQDES
jgi:uroporphyrinogen decarboxylase